MFQTDQSTAAPSLPNPAAAGPQGFFTSGNPVAGLPATILDADFLNMTMMELINIVEAAGLTPSKTTYNQVLTAIKLLMQQSVSNVGVDTGAANAYVVAFTPALSAPVPWVPFWFEVAHTNTGASTLNATGTAQPLVGGAHLPLQGNELVANGNALVYWNPTLASGAGEYVLMFCSGASEQTAAATSANQAVNLGQANSLFAALAGLSTQAFSAANGATGNQVVNISQFPASLAGNGYQKLPGGLILQWGTASATSSVDAAVTFPLAFQNGVFSVTSSVITSVGTANMVTVNSQSNSGVNIGAFSAAGTRVSATVQWHAFGR